MFAKFIHSDSCRAMSIYQDIKALLIFITISIVLN